MIGATGGCGDGEYSEKGSDSRCILKAKPEGCAGIPDGKYERKRGEMKKINCPSMLTIIFFVTSKNKEY